MTQTTRILPTLRRARPADAAEFARMMGHPDVVASLLQLPFPSEEMWRTRLEAMAVPNAPEVQLVAERDGHIVGGVGLHPAVQLRRRHCAALGISVVPDSQNQGIGKLLMQTTCDYADGWAQILRIELTVFADNARAIHLYESFGFRHEGRMRAFALRDGVYADALSMARLHPRPPVAAWPAT